MADVRTRFLRCLSSARRSLHHGVSHPLSNLLAMLVYIEQDTLKFEEGPRKWSASRVDWSKFFF